MSISEVLNAIVKDYTDLLTSLGLGYDLQVNNTYTAYSVSVTGTIEQIRNIVVPSILTGSTLNDVVLAAGYTGYTALNSTLDPVTGLGSLRSEFSYQPLLL